MIKKLVYCDVMNQDLKVRTRPEQLKVYDYLLLVTVYPGYNNDFGYDDCSDIQNTFLVQAELLSLPYIPPPNITPLYITTFRDIRHILLAPMGVFLLSLLRL